MTTDTDVLALVEHLPRIIARVIAARATRDQSDKAELEYLAARREYMTVVINDDNLLALCAAVREGRTSDSQSHTMSRREGYMDAVRAYGIETDLAALIELAVERYP